MISNNVELTYHLVELLAQPADRRSGTYPGWTGILLYPVSTQMSAEVDGDNQKPIHTLDQAFELADSEGLPQASTPRSQLATAAPNLKAECDPRLSEQRRRMLTQNTSPKYAKHSYEKTQQAVENFLQDFFIFRTAEIEESTKNAPCQYIETILADTV